MKKIKIKINVKSIAEENLLKKFSIAFIFMALVPIILGLYIMQSFNMAPVLEQQIPYFRITIYLVVCLVVACFFLIRGSMKSLVNFALSAKEIANGRYDKRVVASEKDEIGVLQNSFNKITSELEAKIKELQESKDLLQRILHKVASAVTSSRGIDDLLELILETLAKGTDAVCGAIFLLDESGASMKAKVSYGMARLAMRKDFNLIPDKGLIGKAIQSKGPEAASNVSSNGVSRYEYENGLAKDSIVVTPLIIKDKVLGVITISDKRKGAFNQDDIILLSNVASQTAVAIQNFQLSEDAEKTYLETITALAMAVEAKDTYSRGHLERVSRYVELLGKQLYLNDETMKILKSGAYLHDVGKIGIRDEVLMKEGPLTKDETLYMREHVIIGVNIIKPIKSMAALCDLVRHHQEFYDGTGYPDGLKGDDIPLIARILKICDAYDAMTTDRRYREAMSKEEARQELKRASGSEFDPRLVEEFLKLV